MLLPSCMYSTGTTIGFERPEYSFNENQLPPLVTDTIFIIKEDNRTSELTFTIRVLVASGTAVNLQDFVAQAQRTEEFLPTQDRIDVSVLIIDDTIPEGDESFQIEIANAGDVSFDTSRASTTITILDNEGERACFHFDTGTVCFHINLYA